MAQAGTKSKDRTHSYFGEKRAFRAVDEPGLAWRSDGENSGAAAVFSVRNAWVGLERRANERSFRCSRR
jgi:hypothetical protein